uniref:Uncharacterized protein n=1 Tax=Oryzias sinensis TaxID=183150 RepID=A0A8C7X0K7_9TELE
MERQLRNSQKIYQSSSIPSIVPHRFPIANTCINCLKLPLSNLVKQIFPPYFLLLYSCFVFCTS